jgi:translation initiation factor 1 (eIF-1/SUI1)
MQENQEYKIKQNQEPELSSIEMQNQLFSEIEKKQNEMSRQDLLVLAGQVFDYSVEDGLRLAGKIKLTPKEIGEIVSTPSFFIKHQDLAESLQEEIGKLDTIPKEDKLALGITQSYDKYSTDKDNGDFFRKYQNKKPEILQGEARSLQLGLDKLYLKYIQNREIQNIKENDFRTEGERLAESNLYIAQRALGENYYSGSLLDLVYKKMVKDGVIESKKYSDDEKKELILEYLKKNKDFSQKDLLSVFNTQFVSKEDADKLKEKLDLSEGSLDKARYRPIDVVYATEKSMAEKELETELNQSLSKHMDAGVGVFLDSEDSVYKLNIELEKKDEKKENEIIPRVEINVGKYFHILDTKEINGQVVFRAQKKEYGKWVVVVDGIEGSEYLNIEALTAINGQVSYVAQKEIDKWIVIAGKETGNEDEYQYIHSLIEINGQVVCAAQKKENGKWVVVVDGIEGSEYSHIEDLTAINGQVAYVAQKKNGKKVILVGDKEDKESEKYQSVNGLTEINGQLAYRARTGNKSIVVVNGIEGSKYDSIGILTKISGQVAYCAGRNKKYVVVVGDQESNQEYQWIGDITEINGQVVYTAIKENGAWVVVVDGIEGSEYGLVVKPTEINGQVAYIALVQKDNKYVVVISEEEHKEEFDQIHFLKPKPEGLLVCAQIGDIVKTFTIKVPKQNKLTVKEQEKLDLLNLVHDPKLEQIDQYFEEKIIKEGEKKVGVSKTILGRVKDFIKKSPELFLQTLSAKKDRLPDLYIKQIVKKIFPQAYQESNNRYFGLSRNIFIGGGSGLEPMLEDDLSGGDPTNEAKKDIEIMKLHNPISDLIITNVYGKYDKEAGSWKKIFFPVNNNLIEPENNTITLNIPKGKKNIVLPKPINSQIISERVKQKNSSGVEKDLQIQTNSLGEVEVAVDADSKTVVYSIEQSSVAPVIENVSNKTYEKFKKQFNKSFRKDLSEQTAILPEDLTEFVESIKNLPPKQRTIEIEKFVREIGYYDDGNKEVMDLKNNKSTEEKLYIMQTRLDELKEKDEKLNKLSHKRYAGVCADFAMLTTAILRKAEILCGVAKGYSAEGTQVNQSNSHGASFAIFPDKKSGNQMIIIDGTPEGVDEKQRAQMRFINTPSLEEKEAKTAEELSKLKIEANKKLDEILKMLASTDLDKIRQMTNGELEDVLNKILKYTVDVSHFHTINRVLESYWYSPIKNKNLDNLEDKVEILKFLSQEIENQRKMAVENEADQQKPAGSLLFETIESYVQKFLKGGKGENNKQCFDLLDGLIDLNKNNLNEIEQKASVAIIAYLRAKNIGGKK